MTKVWDGPTPYDAEKASENADLYHSLFLAGQQEGYRAAMNSPELSALYEALSGIVAEPFASERFGHIASFGDVCGCVCCRARIGKSAYEANLQEVS